MYVLTYKELHRQHRHCVLKRTGEFLEAVSQRGKVARGCNKQQLKEPFSLYKPGQNLSRGDLTGGVTSRNDCVVGFSP